MVERSAPQALQRVSTGTPTGCSAVAGATDAPGEASSTGPGFVGLSGSFMPNPPPARPGASQGPLARRARTVRPGTAGRPRAGRAPGTARTGPAARPDPGGRGPKTGSRTPARPAGPPPAWDPPGRRRRGPAAAHDRRATWGWT